MNLNFVKQHGTKIYYLGLLVSASLLASTPASASPPTGTCAVSGQAWLTKISDLIADPLSWLMYLTAATTVIFLIWGGLMLRSARGRQDKVDKANSFFMYFGGGSFIIFSASGIGTWFMGKFGCVI